MAPAALVVLTTLATEEDARRLVTALVGERLVACGTLLPRARSIYRWEGELTEEDEVLVVLKTDASKWDAPDEGAPAGTAAPATAAPGLDELVAREPDNVGLLLQRAEVLCARRHLTAAQRDLERVLRQEPGNLDALATLGLVLSRKGLWIEAAAQFKSVVELDPGRAAAWYYLGEALNHVDDLAGALTAFERA